MLQTPDRSATLSASANHPSTLPPFPVITVPVSTPATGASHSATLSPAYLPPSPVITVPVSTPATGASHSATLPPAYLPPFPVITVVLSTPATSASLPSTRPPYPVITVSLSTPDICAIHPYSLSSPIIKDPNTMTRSLTLTARLHATRASPAATRTLSLVFTRKLPATASPVFTLTPPATASPGSNVSNPVSTVSDDSTAKSQTPDAALSDAPTSEDLKNLVPQSAKGVDHSEEGPADPPQNVILQVEEGAHGTQAPRCELCETSSSIGATEGGPGPQGPSVMSAAEPKATFLDAWFPALQERSYLIPTAHFQTVHAYEKIEYGGGEFERLKSMADIDNKKLDSIYNTAARNVLALENILARLHESMKIIQKKSKDVMVMMTQMTCGMYRSVYAGAADMNSTAASSKDGKHAEDLKRKVNIDVSDLLVVNRDRGILIGACVRNNDGDSESLQKKLRNAIDYLNKARDIVKKYVIKEVDGASTVPVHTTLLLPNLKRSAFERVKTKLDECPGKGSDVTLRCLCRDDMDDGPRLMQWWKTCRGDEVTMKENVYRELVYRFAVPLMTVELYLASKPRVQLWDKGQVVHALGKEYGRGWTRLALFPEQARVLEEKPEDEERDDDVILLHGPPGTSKTFLLMLRASFWLSRYKPVVAIVQTKKEGWAAACLVQNVLQEVVKKVGGGGVKMIDMSGVEVDGRGKVCSGLKQLDAGLEELCRGAVGGAVHLLADEADAALVGAIYSGLKERGMVVRMWAAGVVLTIPDNLEEKVRVLRQPLRCPGTVTEEVRRSRLIGESYGGGVPAYSEPEVARAHRGLPPDVIKVDGKVDSEEAGRAVGKHLKKLGVGVSGVRPPGGQRALRYKDVFVLGMGRGRDFSAVVDGLRAERVPARHVPTRGRRGELTAAGRDWVGGLATGGGEDAVTVTDHGTVTGLERPVVVWLDEGEVGDVADTEGRLHGMSRSTAHLVIVRGKE